MAQDKKTIPYTYLIGWPEYNLWYYGVRYANGCCPTDLWNPYTTSSKHVADTVKQYGIPPVRLIRKTFKDPLSARVWESRVLKRMNVVKDFRWLNKTDTQVFEPQYGDKNPMRDPSVVSARSGENHHNKKIENRIKISDSHKSKGDSHHTKSTEFRRKMSEIISSLGEDHPMRKSSKIDHPMKSSKNRSKARENNTGPKNPMFGKTHKKLYCSHCCKQISVNTYSRWHGEKCKEKFTNMVENTVDSV